MLQIGARFHKTLVTRYSLPNHKISGELKSWDKLWMYWLLWTSLVVAMHDDIENTSVGTDHVITVIYQSIALPGDLNRCAQRCMGQCYFQLQTLIFLWASAERIYGFELIDFL